MHRSTPARSEGYQKLLKKELERKYKCFQRRLLPNSGFTFLPAVLLLLAVVGFTILMTGSLGNGMAS